MPDDNHPPDANAFNPDMPEIAPSTIFVELMRQAAARRQPTPPVIAETPPTPESAPTPPVAADPVLPEIPTEAPRPRRERLNITPQPLALPTTEPVLPAEPPPSPPVEEVAVSAPPDPQREALMEAQRIQRVQRRREKTSRQRAGVLGGFTRTTLILLLAGGLASTIFTWFTTPDFLDKRVTNSLVVAESTLITSIQPTVLPTPNYLRKIGVVSGHRGPQNDPGAVCPDGLTEASITFAVSTGVVRNLRALGYSVDLLDEFDERLNNYQAAALISIHANTCRDFGEPVSGFLVAKAAVRPQGGIDDLLAECTALNYSKIIGLERRFNLTADMTDYHTFREIHPLTPAAIIELGFMKDDREVLTTRQDDMAQAITEGILCFLQPDSANPNILLTTPDFFLNTATPSATP